MAHIFHTEAFWSKTSSGRESSFFEQIKHPRYDYQETVPPDGTHITDSIYRAVEQINKAANPSDCRVIIVVTDNRPWETWILHSRKAVRNELFDSGAVVYGVVTKGRAYLPGGTLNRVERRNKGGYVNDYAGPTGGILLG
jgi:hypothetical protein